MPSTAEGRRKIDIAMTTNWMRVRLIINFTIHVDRKRGEAIAVPRMMVSIQVGTWL